MNLILEKLMVSTAAITLGFIQSTPVLSAPEPNLLWQFAQECVWAEQNKHDLSSKCPLVGKDTQGNYAYVIKQDVAGTSQYLLIPTTRITGIESPYLLTKDAPNYFAYAWDAASFTSKQRKSTIPRESLSLAVNSAAGRSMHQLHIHIDCVRSDVREALKKHDNEITTQWRSIRDANWVETEKVFNGHDYHVRWVDGPTLHGVNLFRLVADRNEDAQGNMALQTIVVVGGPERNHLPGFYVLTDQAHIRWGEKDTIPNNPGSGEDLMDHDKCSV